MPPSTRRGQPTELPQFIDPPSDPEQLSDEEEVAEELLEEEEEEEEVADEDEDGAVDSNAHVDRPTAPPPPPPGLKEISSLASWTVSSSKPGCGVTALRAPSTSLFWQSDGPQPHHLNIHFFKLVEIVGMRIYLDFDLDESYTPILIRFAAGTGYNDLQEFSSMRFEQPRGWMEVDFEGVGEPEADEDSELEGIEGDEEKENQLNLRKMPVLRCMLVQVRICENHQNGKDTHLRGLQIFARDSGKRGGEGMRTGGLGVPSSVGVERRRKKGWDMDVPEWAIVPELR